MDEALEFEDLKKEVEEIQSPEKAAEIIKRYEGFQVLKRFKEKEKFVTLVSELGIHKTTIIFEVNVFKLCKKYQKLLKSYIGLGFLKPP